MIYGYLRVSRDHQTVDNQKFEINRFFKKSKLKVNSWIEETISGTKVVDKRQLGQVIVERIRQRKLIRNKIDSVVGIVKTERIRQRAKNIPLTGYSSEYSFANFSQRLNIGSSRSREILLKYLLGGIDPYGIKLFIN